MSECIQQVVELLQIQVGHFNATAAGSFVKLLSDTDFLVCTCKPACCLQLLSVSLFQNIVPHSSVKDILELFVPENKLNTVQAEAEMLPSVEITKVSSCMDNVLWFSHYLAVWRVEALMGMLLEGALFLWWLCRSVAEVYGDLKCGPNPQPFSAVSPPRAAASQRCQTPLLCYYSPAGSCAMKVCESGLKTNPRLIPSQLSARLWMSPIWSKTNESAEEAEAEGKDKQPLSVPWWQECHLGLFCSWICSGCRCWAKAGPLRWPASCARQSTCKWSILAPCWMVRTPMLCISAGQQAAAWRDAYPVVSQQAAT